MGYEQIRMEDLLQAQFDNEQNLLLFEGMASFSINMLIHQINKSESFFSEAVEGLTDIFRILRLIMISTVYGHFIGLERVMQFCCPVYISLS